MPAVISTADRKLIDTFIAKARKEKREIRVPTGAYTIGLDVTVSWRGKDANGSTWEKVHKFSNEGMSIKAIAKRLNIRESTVGYHLKRTKQTPVRNSDTKDRVKLHHENGLSAMEIAKRLTLSVQTVHYHLRRL